MTQVTSKNVISVLAGNGLERGRYIAARPANRTQVISPHIDRIIRRRLTRIARLHALRLYLLLPLIEFRYLAIKIRYRRNQMIRRVISGLAQFLENTGHRKPL